MLDHKSDRPSGPTDDVEDALFRDVPDEGGTASNAGGGGALGRFGTGVRAQPSGERSHKPLWRRIAVFLLTWLTILIVAFLALSALAVFIIGWTGPPPTFNMAQKAMSGVEVRKTWVPLKDVSANLVRAVISSEDTRFCQHHGFDMVELQKAIDEADAGGRVRGASTISQQTAKNVFLFNGGGIVRKGFEAWFTLLIEKMWTKARIMEVYMNVAEWGDGYYGAEAAAHARFNVSARQLTSRQAALLAAVLPSPNRWKVTGNYAQQRAGKIQTVMGVVRRDALDACVVKR
jgi:monofunctional biosynthetic peptidoglycan transglycosylase